MFGDIEGFVVIYSLHNNGAYKSGNQCELNTDWSSGLFAAIVEQ